MKVLKPSLSSAYPWLVWILAASFFYYKYLIQVSPSVMSTELMRDFALTGAGLGNLAACFFYGYLIMQIPVGIILDKWSPRYVTSIAALSCALGVFLFANAHSILTAGFSRFLIGLSASFAAVSCFKLASVWFPPKRFAFVAGLSMTAAMFGAVGGEGPLSLLITEYNWREALKLVAFGGFILSFLIWLLVRDKKIAHLPIHSNSDLTLRSKFKIILQDRQTWLLSLYSGLAFAPVSVFGGLWGVAFLEKAYLFTTPEAAHLLSFIFIGFAIGCPITGWYSDQIGKRKPLMWIGSLAALLSLIFIIYIPAPLLVLSILLFIFGVGASCFFLCFSMIRELYPLIFTATVLGFMNTFDAVCEALAEPFIGKLLDIRWDGTYLKGARSFSLSDYHFGLAALVIFLAVACILLFFINETHCKPREE